MNKELIERLRNISSEDDAGGSLRHYDVGCVCENAADTIEAQVAEIEELKIEMKQVYQAHKADEEQIERQAALLKQCKGALADILRNHGDEVWGHGGEEALAAIEAWEKS